MLPKDSWESCSLAVLRELVIFRGLPSSRRIAGLQGYQESLGSIFRELALLRELPNSRKTARLQDSQESLGSILREGVGQHLQHLHETSQPSSAHTQHIAPISCNAGGGESCNADRVMS